MAIGLCNTPEPQYSYVDGAPLGVPGYYAAPGTVDVWMPDANTFAACEQSKSTVVFCFEVQEAANSLSVPTSNSSDPLAVQSASATGNTDVVYSTGTSEPAARCPLNEASAPGAIGHQSAGYCPSNYPQVPAPYTTSWSTLAPGGSLNTSPPNNNTPPNIAGTAYIGQTLTASTGTWSNTPTSYFYQWEDCNSVGLSCVNISGATNSTYTLAGADDGHTIVVQVTATNAGGPGLAVASFPTAPVIGIPTNGALPAITGTAYVGQALTGSPGSWTDAPASYAYQWYDCTSVLAASCTSLGSGATGTTYSPVVAQEGTYIGLVISATNLAGTGAAPIVMSAQVVGLPVYGSGAAWSGNTYTTGGLTITNNGSWTESPTITHNWYVCTSQWSGCTSVSSAGSYTPSAAYEGDYIEVQILATTAAGSASTWLQNGTQILGPPVYQGSANWSGNTYTNGGLSITNNGSWTESPSISYAWYVCTSQWSGCTWVSSAGSYTPNAGNAGDYIEVEIVATNSAGSANTWLQDGNQIVNPPVNTSAPYIYSSQIDGIQPVGTPWTEWNGNWSYGPTSYNYQWYICSTNYTSSCTDRWNGGNNYTPTVNDLGESVTLYVQACNAAGCSGWAAASNSLQSPAGYYYLSDTMGPNSNGCVYVPTSSFSWVNFPSYEYDSGSTQLNLQDNGNLVDYYNGSPNWVSYGSGSPQYALCMQGDGNFVEYNGGGGVLWNLEAQSRAAAMGPGDYMVVIPGGFVILNSGGQWVWAS